VGIARGVVRPQLAVRGLGLLRMALHVETLVVQRTDLRLGTRDVEGRVPLTGAQLLGCRLVGEGTQAGSDGVVRARFHPHVVRWVGVNQVHRVAGQQPVHVLGLSRIATEQSVVSENPRLSRLVHRLVGWFGHLVGIAQALRDVGKHATSVGPSRVSYMLVLL